MLVLYNINLNTHSTVYTQRVVKRRSSFPFNCILSLSLSNRQVTSKSEQYFVVFSLSCLSCLVLSCLVVSCLALHICSDKVVLAAKNEQYALRTYSSGNPLMVAATASESGGLGLCAEGVSTTQTPRFRCGTLASPSKHSWP